MPRRTRPARRSRRGSRRWRGISTGGSRRSRQGGGREAEEAARAEAQAIATQLIAMRAAAAQTELFADRIALLEASLPRLSVTQSLMMQALERQAGAAPAAEAGPAVSELGPEAGAGVRARIRS